MDQGFIKLYRKLLDWEWYTESVVKDTFIHILLKANHSPKKWRGIEIVRGSFITSRKQLSIELKFTEQQIRTALNKLKSTNDITIKTTNKYTVITVVNYDSYQNKQTPSNQQNNESFNQQLTNNQPTINQQITTTKELKNKKNDKNDKNKKNIDPLTPTPPTELDKPKKEVKHKYGEFKKVLLTDTEYKSLDEIVEHVEDLIKILDEYIETSGKKYKNHYLMLKNKWPMTEYKKLYPVEIVKKNEEPLVDENKISNEDFEKMLSKYD